MNQKDIPAARIPQLIMLAGLILAIIGCVEIGAGPLYKAKGQATKGHYTSNSGQISNYEFVLPDGTTIQGSTNFSGVRGQDVDIEYIPFAPNLFNRVAGSAWRSKKWAPWVFAVGLFFMFVGFTSHRSRAERLQNKQWLIQRGEKVQGEVEQILYEQRQIRYVFQAQTGKTFKSYTMQLSTDLVKSVHKGDAVEILYDPAQPKKSIWVKE